jgi:hypothetical protein
MWNRLLGSNQQLVAYSPDHTFRAKRLSPTDVPSDLRATVE